MPCMVDFVYKSKHGRIAIEKVFDEYTMNEVYKELAAS